jgi:CRP-like cAMP-binding protein
VPIESYELCRGLTRDEVRLLGAVLEHRRYRQGEVMVQVGAESREIFFIHRGTAVITLEQGDGKQRRLGIFPAGMAFGEIGMLDGAPRSAVVTAETELECHLLKREDFEALGERSARIKIILLKNMALGLARLLRKATREMSVFDH